MPTSGKPESFGEADRLVHQGSRMLGTRYFSQMVEGYERLIYRALWGCCGSERYCELHDEVRNKRNAELGGHGIRRFQAEMVLFQELAQIRKAHAAGLPLRAMGIGDVRARRRTDRELRRDLDRRGRKLRSPRRTVYSERPITFENNARKQATQGRLEEREEDN